MVNKFLGLMCFVVLTACGGGGGGEVLRPLQVSNHQQVSLLFLPTKGFRKMQLKKFTVLLCVALTQAAIQAAPTSGAYISDPHLNTPLIKRQGK
jgi:hypothetical protein